VTESLHYPARTLANPLSSSTVEVLFDNQLTSVSTGQAPVQAEIAMTFVDPSTGRQQPLIDSVSPSSSALGARRSFESAVRQAVQSAQLPGMKARPQALPLAMVRSWMSLPSSRLALRIMPATGAAQ